MDDIFIICDVLRDRFQRVNMNFIPFSDDYILTMWMIYISYDIFGQNFISFSNVYILAMFATAITNGKMPLAHKPDQLFWGDLDRFLIFFIVGHNLSSFDIKDKSKDTDKDK